LEIELVGRIVVSEPFDKLKGEFFKTLGHPARIKDPGVAVGAGSVGG